MNMKSVNKSSVTKLLSKVELFQGIGEQDLTLFAEHAQRNELMTGDILFRTKDLTDALYVIESGSIQLFDDQGEREKSLTVFFQQ